MRASRAGFLLLLFQVMLGTSIGWAGACSEMSVGKLSSLNGFVPFAASSLWNTNVADAAVDSKSGSIINYIGANVTLHPDFGSGEFDGQSIGIPYQVVSGSKGKVTVRLGEFDDQSDPGPMPIPSDALIEGYPAPGDGDRHVLVLEKDGCWLYELYNSFALARGNWSADSTAIWDMTIDEQRPYTWTSADAAGLPIFNGLARYDEVAAGSINHALRFTVPRTRRAFTPPASHWASSIDDVNAPPMGTRLRLKSSFDISSYSAANRVILTALKNYGMILADNGTGIFISGAPDDRWDNDDLGQLKNITASSFEVVAMSNVYTNVNVPDGAPPTVGSFVADHYSVAPGKAVTLSWSTTDANYNIISPGVGPVRGTSVVVNPSSLTTYTLYSANQFGRTTASLTVKVQLKAALR